MSKYINLSAIKQFLIGLRNAFDGEILYNAPMSVWNYGESDTIPTTFPTVVLSKNYTNYKRLIIEAISNDGVYTTVTILNPTALKSFNIWNWSIDSSNILHLKIMSCILHLNNNSPTVIINHWKSGEKTIANQNTTFTQGYFFKITKVIGYKH